MACDRQDLHMLWLQEVVIGSVGRDWQTGHVKWYSMLSVKSSFFSYSCNIALVMA